jgi:hypothetical protein
MSAAREIPSPLGEREGPAALRREGEGEMPLTILFLGEYRDAATPPHPDPLPEGRGD